MNKLSIPIYVKPDTDVNDLIGVLKEAKAQRAFIVVSRFSFGDEHSQNELAKQLSKIKNKLEENKIEAAAWINTMGFGGAVKGLNKEACKNYTRKMSISKTQFDDSFCPLDEQFVKAVCSFIKQLAKNGFEMIMLDDDFTLSASPGIGCCCDLHLHEFCLRIGENINREEIADKVFTGGKNTYRDVWFKLMSETLENFCHAIRNAADEVNPDVRLGLCAGFTSWDMDGADIINLTDILAGKTKPFLRLTGAPYWYPTKRFGKYSFQLITECVRQQVQWCENRKDIEIFSENDCYPRLQAITPAVHTELFDQVLRVSDGIDTLKYVISYTEPNERNRYLTEHLNNTKLYDEISEVFDNKECIGIRIYENMHVVKNAALPVSYNGENSILNMWFNQSSQIPITHAIPTTYNGTGFCGMAFGENAKYLPENAFDKGLILDLKAAEILQESGIDVGLVSKEKITEGVCEHFDAYDTDEALYANTVVYDVKLKPNAKVLSVFVGETQTYPSVYLYRNDNGQRFMVYSFDIQQVLPQAGLLLSFSRGRQLNDAMEFLAGQKMPVECNGNPLLYCICKQNRNSYAAAYFNCHDDEVINAEIKLALKPKQVRFINCDGFEKDGQITINRIPPYKMAALEIIT